MSGRSLSEIDRAGWVFTPGGPRPRANVHEVNPGDVIIHDRGTGGSTIFRAANAAGSEAGRGRWRNSSSRPVAHAPAPRCMRSSPGQ